MTIEPLPWTRKIAALADDTNDLASLRVPVGEVIAEARRALQIIDSLGTSHIIELRPDGWEIMHPAVCRPHLLDCPTHRAVTAKFHAEIMPQVFGRYTVTRHDDDVLTFERVH